MTGQVLSKTGQVLSKTGQVLKVTGPHAALSALSLLLLVGPVGLACSEGGQRPTSPANEAGGSAGSDGSGGDATPSSGGEAAGGALPEEMIYLPFAVDDHFVPYGFMGAGTDGALKRDPNECAPRPEGAQGECHRYDYIVPEAADGWAGLYWLTTYENWGSTPGRPVDGGARRVVFQAASDPPGVLVRFFAGGLDSDLAYSDDFNRWVEPVLTADLTEVEIDLVGAEYSSGVLGGFGFSLASAVPVTIYLDDIRWE